MQGTSLVQNVPSLEDNLKSQSSTANNVTWGHTLGSLQGPDMQVSKEEYSV